MKKTVGIIGLGEMGEGIARSIQKAGFPLVVYDLNPEPIKRIVDLGASPAKNLSDILKSNGSSLKYAIHPVAGRMPGHMNVLLAEANVSYDNLLEPKDVNPKMKTIDVVIVIGANDVVNPSATEQPGSPIYGMPIIEAHQAKTVIVLKRSMSSGFAGVQNPLFFKENTRMLFGDAKESLQRLSSELKNL